jgi:2-keto-4-pentenoate hydratase/2-oxohepta-3-ene-1,7-dioic acid hydratase in catechol pathway
MKHKKMIITISSAAVLALGLGTYLFIPPCYDQLSPAKFDCLTPEQDGGSLVPLKLNPKNIYGMGLTYSKHIKETASPYDPGTPPVIFRKERISLSSADSKVKLPEQHDVLRKVEQVEPGLSKKLGKKFDKLPLLLDYEVELAFVLLSDIDWKQMDDTNYAPELGYFIANDLSARSIAVLGEGQTNRYDYWGASKSFAGFLPVGSQMWVPDHQHANSVFATTLTTRVNGEVRQEQSTTDMIYTPKQMLAFIAQKYPNHLPQKGDVVLTGTPGGVAMQVPQWKARLGNLFRVNRFIKLASVIRANKNNDNFLKPGDEVIISGGILGEVKTQIID